MRRFLDELADASPAPGAGAVAAVTTAMAAGLLAMAARASRDAWADARGVAAQAEALRDRAAPLADLNAAAYADAIGLLARSSDSDRGGRDSELGAALSRAAALPLSIAETATDITELGVLVAEHAVPEARADAIAAVLLADAAAHAAAHLVRVNLTAQPGDERMTRAEELVAASSGAARRVHPAD